MMAAITQGCENQMSFDVNSKEDIKQQLFGTLVLLKA
jgi:hypothetical protein